MKHIIAIVGMAGSGKSQAGDFFKQKNIPVLRFGDIADEALKEQGLELTEENERPFRENLRKELGMAAFAIKMEPKIEKARETFDLFVLDGMYSWEEYLYVKEKFPDLIILCIYASPQVRYTRLLNRPIRPLNRDEARSRDISEINNLNKGGPIAMADFLVKNEGSLDDLQVQLERVWRELV
jgi:dephospho-CoA kinase